MCVVKSPRRFPRAARPSTETACSRQRSPVWRQRATSQISRVERMRPVRSARTRRSVQVGAGVQGGDYGTNENLCFGCREMDCNNDPVRHKSSPSHRDVSRRVISSLVSSNRSAATEHRNVRRLAAACLPQPVRWLRVPVARFRRSLWSLLFDAPLKMGDIAGEILTQTNRPHIAMSCQSSFAWKASLTRTPPPICASAPGSQTALIWRAVGVADKK